MAIALSEFRLVYRSGRKETLVVERPDSVTGAARRDLLLGNISALMREGALLKYERADFGPGGQPLLDFRGKPKVTKVEA